MRCVGEEGWGMGGDGVYVDGEDAGSLVFLEVCDSVCRDCIGGTTTDLCGSAV